MNIFKSWRAQGSVTKAQKLWEEFKQVSHLKNEPETLLRLKKFLDHVQRSLKEFLAQNESKKPIDEILGEASDVLASLLQFLSDYDSEKARSSSNSTTANEVLNQVLEIAEFILRDPKYKKQIENSPTILNNFLGVADKLEKSESKVILVKLIILIAENVDSKVSFVQKEGFSKLMHLLLDKDERVSRMISRALLHFLQIDNSDESRLLNEMKGQIEEKEEFNSIKTKIKKIALDFRKFTFSEIQRIFLQSEVAAGNNIQSTQQQQQQQSASADNNQKQESLKSAQKLLFETNELTSPPNYEDIFETDLRMLIALQISKESAQNDLSNILSNEQLELSVNSADKSQRIKTNSANVSQTTSNQQQQQGVQNQNVNPNSIQKGSSHPSNAIGEEFEANNNSSSTSKQNNNNNHEQNSDQSDDIFTILQGGFKAILDTLTPATSLEVQLNLTATIQKLLSNEDQKYKIEFQRLKGYEHLLSIFNHPRAYIREDLSGSGGVNGIGAGNNNLNNSGIGINNSSNNNNNNNLSGNSNNQIGSSTNINGINNNSNTNINNNSNSNPNGNGPAAMSNLNFLENLFKIYMEIIVGDATKSNQIVNFEAFEQLNLMISSSQQFEVISAALDQLSRLFKSNWKNLIIARRLKISYHLLAMTLRLFDTDENGLGLHKNSNHVLQQSNWISEDADTAASGSAVAGVSSAIRNSTELQQSGVATTTAAAATVGVTSSVSVLEELKSIYKGGNAIIFTSDITKRKEVIGTRQREDLLEKVNGILRMYAFVEGTFSTEFEYAFAEIILASISRNASKNKTVYFLDMLIEFLEKKAPRRCNKMFTFDNQSIALIGSMNSITQILLAKIKSPLNQSNQATCLTSDECVFYLGKILVLTEQCLSCDHSNQIENEDRMKQLEHENTLIKYIICRNQCEETKTIIQEKFVNKLTEREETLLLMQVIDVNKMKSNIEYTHLNIAVIAVLKDILINSSQRATQFIQNDGFSLLAYLAFKITQDPSFMQRLGLIFMDLGLNLNNSQAILSDPLLKINDKKIPIVDAKRIQWVNSMFCSFFSVNLNDSHHMFFEYLSRLLLHSDNMKTLKQDTAILSFILELLGSGRVSSVHNNLYTQLLSLFERFVSKLTANELKQVLDHLLNNSNLNNLGKARRTDTAFFTDQLSILAIHMLLKTTPLILEKIVTEKYILNLFGLLDSPSAEVKEMVLKFILSSMSVYSKSKKKEGYGKKEQFYYLLGKKLLAGHVTQNICKILYAFTFWEESPSILYPSNSSVVSTLFNRSEQAGVIMQKSQSEQTKGAKVITNVDMLEIFFKVLRGYEPTRCTHENAATFRNEMLSVFEVVLDEPININIILEQANFLNWFYVMLPPNWKGLSDKRIASKHSRNNVSSQSSQDSSTTSNNNINALPQINSQIPTAAQLANASRPSVNEFGSNNFQTNDSVDSTNNNNNNNNQNIVRSESQSGVGSAPMDQQSILGHSQSPILPASQQQILLTGSAAIVQCKMEREKVLGIVHKIMLYYFHKKSGGNEFMDMMKHYTHADEEFLVAIAQNFFNYLLHNCIVKDDPPQNFLKKFKEFVDNIDVIVGFDAEISILILQCIIRMVSKNSPAIRSIMKELKLFDKRDSLIIRILTYDLDGDTFVKVFEGISFEALANHKEFHDKHTLSSIVKILIEKSSNFSLQMILISILKNPTFSEKNQKYIIDLLEQSKIIQFFYPSFKRKQGSLAKCLQSNQNNTGAKQNSSNNDDNDDSDDSLDEDAVVEDQHRGASKGKSKGMTASSQSSQSQSGQQRGASFEVDFLHEFYSEAMADIRKQILLRINVNLTPVLKQYEIEDKKTKKKRDESKLKYVEANDKDLQNAQIKVSDLEYEINKKLTASTSDFAKKQKEINEMVEKKLTDGENLFEKLSQTQSQPIQQQSSLQSMQQQSHQIQLPQQQQQQHTQLQQ